MGTVAALLGATTCVTDKAYVLPLLWANARLNAHDCVERGHLWAETIEWGQKLPKRLLRASWNFVLASDVVGCGDQALFPPLLKTLKQLCCSEDTKIIMSYKPRARSVWSTLCVRLGLSVFVLREESVEGSSVGLTGVYFGRWWSNVCLLHAGFLSC